MQLRQPRQTRLPRQSGVGRYTDAWKAWAPCPVTTPSTAAVTSNGNPNQCQTCPPSGVAPTASRPLQDPGSIAIPGAMRVVQPLSVARSGYPSSPNPLPIQGISRTRAWRLRPPFDPRNPSTTQLARRATTPRHACCSILPSARHRAAQALLWPGQTYAATFCDVDRTTSVETAQIDAALVPAATQPALLHADPSQ